MQLPNVKVKGIESIKITNYEITTSKEDIDKKINEIAKNQNAFKDKEKGEPANQGDLVVFDYKATVDGKDFEGGEGKNTQIILGKDLFIKGFDKQLIGVKENSDKINEPKTPDKVFLGLILVSFLHLNTFPKI